MSALEWPPHATISAEGRRAIQEEHDQQERARAAQQRHHPPPARAAPPSAASASQLAALAKRVNALERFNREILPDGIGKALADLRHEIGTKPLDPGAVREAVGAAMAQLHAGIWRAERGFPQGCMVTHDGSLWLAATASTGIRPGSGAAAWQLVVKGHHPRKKDPAK